MPVTAMISNISRGSLHDGNGVRTVVYFKGCALRCKWCHNPETFSKNTGIMFAESKCIACGKCIAVCPDCHKESTTFAAFIREKCTACGECAKICPTGALSLCGSEMSIEEIFREIEKDRHYYNESGGGVTLSGGECLLWADFAAKLLERCKASGIHTTIETSLYAPFENLEKLLPHLDMIFADLKIPDAEKHREYTGQSNRLIIENLTKLSKIFNNIIIRIPLIPGLNDSESDMTDFGKIISTFSGGIKGIELLKYNYLAESKYRCAGIPYTDFGRQSQSDSKMDELCAALYQALSGKYNVYWSK